MSIINDCGKAAFIKLFILFQQFRQKIDYQGYPALTSGRSGSMPILVGAAIIAVAILLSSLLTAVSTRFVGIESPTDENLWLVDRLTGAVYKCQAPDRGKASCDADHGAASIGRPSR